MIGRSREELRSLFPHCEVVEPTNEQIQIDWDQPSFQPFFRLKATRLLEGLLGLKVESVTGWTSKSGNKHVVVTLTQEAALEDRVTWALMLGSDREREKLNWVRAKRGDDFAICLLRPRESQITTITE